MYSFNKENHLHTLKGQPLTGVSSVMKVVSKPLTWWASGLAVREFGWTDPKKTDKDKRLEVAGEALIEVKELTNEDYLKKLDKAYRAHSVSLDKSADDGTDLHSLLEEYVLECLRENNGVPKVITLGNDKVGIFSSWASQNVKKFLWSEAHTYSEKNWLGGISDCGAEMNDGGIAIIDFKSSKDAYPTHFWQIAGYDICISETGGFNHEGARMLDPVKISQHIVFPFGSEKPTGHIRYDTDKGREAFLAALVLYRQLNNYN